MTKLHCKAFFPDHYLAQFKKKAYLTLLLSQSLAIFVEADFFLILSPVRQSKR